MRHEHQHHSLGDHIELQLPYQVYARAIQDNTCEPVPQQPGPSCPPPLQPAQQTKPQPVLLSPLLHAGVLAAEQHLMLC